MTTATLTSKGQITIPKSIRELLGLDSGDVLEFRLNAQGKVEIEPLGPQPLDRLRGMLQGLTAGRVTSVEEMNEAIADHVADDDLRILAGR
ncbi:MAG: AbrB/MazE/SpoVT family DNA-binding domain-containing protein [Thermoanaerobaculia bacterium]|nr:AbrB/MazE/SpoVT family DNA-binding domain-containing protein [Thermoanaerobaculia bacterium]